MIRILVVDDHTMVRAGLCRLLDGEKDIEVVAQAGAGRDAVELCKQHEPDVVVLDYNLPDQDGLETTRQIVALDLGVRVLILTMYANEEYATRVIRAGASGFIVKASSTDELIEAIRQVSSKSVYVSPAIKEKMTKRMAKQDAPESALSDREMQVLVQLARGATSREVSAALRLSLSTIETYRSRILEKLNLRNNSDMTRFAMRRGLIDID